MVVVVSTIFAPQPTVSPVTGVTWAESAMVPVKPNLGVKVTLVDAPVPPETKLTGVVAEIVKSRTLIVKTKV